MASLLVETGDFLAEVERLRGLSFTADSNLYVAPTAAELAAFRALADALKANDESLAVALADSLNYEVVRYTDSLSGRRFLGTRERLVGGAQTRGWGSYFLQPAFQRDALVEVPHVRFDLHSEELGARSFRDSGARGFLLAGAHRNANGPGSADVAQLTGSVFHQVHASWVGPAARTDSWQVHGYAAANHSFPAGTDAVLSNGDGSVSLEVLALDEALTALGYLSYAYNTLPADSASNLSVNDGLVGTTFSSLGGTTNVQGQLSRSLGGRFLHAEFEQSLRFTPAERQQAASALSQAIQATSSFQVTSSQLVGMSTSQTLFPFGSTWYYKADGSNQGTLWRDLAFDASTWASGAGQLGYGDGDETTVVPSGPSGAFFITTYFRREFTLSDLSALEQLDLSVIRDDGVAIYINGKEVLRNNLAANPSFNTLASATVAGADESTPVQASVPITSLPAGLLQVGRNVLAGEIHQAALNSSDISFDARLNATQRRFQVDVDLDAPLNGATLQTTDLLINGASDALASTLVDGDTVRFTLPQLPGGTTTLELPAGSLEATDGTALGVWRRSITLPAAPQYSIYQSPRLQLGNAPLVGYTGSDTDQVEVLWQTKPAGTGSQDSFTVDVRLAGTTAWSPGGTIQQLAQPVDGRIVFSSRLGGLQYATDYDYRVQHWSGDVLLKEYISPFRTRLPAGSTAPFSWIAYGDSADPSTIQQFRSVQARINSLDQVSPLAFAMLLGDNTYTTGTHTQLDYRFVPNLAPEATAWNARRIDYAAFGNHDIMTDNGGPTEASFSSPIPAAGLTSVASAPASERPEHTFSFDYGNVHIATFDSNSYSNPTRLNAQLTWLEADMAASNAQWKIAVLHHPVAGSPDKPESPIDNYYQQVVPRLRAAKVDLMLAGHSHTYHQSFPLLGQTNGIATFLLDEDGVYDKGAGLVQLVVGTGGTALRSGLFTDKPYIRAGFSTSTTPAVEPGFSRIDVTPDELVVSYVAADDGTILSSFKIRNSPPPPPTNQPPSAVSLTGVTSTLAENTPLPANLKVADIVISDDGLGSNTISLLGADADLFQVVDQGLVLKAGTPLDFEQKATLAVTVQVADSSLAGSLPVSTDYALAITNLQEGPGSAAAISTQGGVAFQEGATLVAGSVMGDPDGISALGTVEWLRNGTPTGQTGSTVVVGPQGAGSWQTRHNYTDGAGLLTSVLSAPATVAPVNNGSGSLAPTTANGPLRVGVSLQAGSVGGDPDGDAADPQTSWQWLRNGTAIPGATTRNYLTSNSDLGASLAVVVSSTDHQGFRSSLTAPALGPFQEGTPPVVAGITVEGRQVTVNFNEAIQATAPALNSVTVRVNGAIRTVSSLSVDSPNRRMLLNLSTAQAAPLSSETVRVEYIDAAGDQTTGTVQDVVGNDLLSFGRDADTLRSASSVPASPALASTYTSLVLTGTTNLNGVGNGNANLIQGNGGANSLDGGLGNDDLQGGAGNDTLVGGAGNDTLRGGAGLDRLTGSAGDDLFDVRGSSDALIGGSTNSPLFESITDLQIAQTSGSDRIDTIATSQRTVRALSSQPTALTRTAITTLLNGSSGGVANFGPSAASAFTFGSGATQRTFLAVNDSLAGYDNTRDQIMEITGLTGSLATLVVI